MNYGSVCSGIEAATVAWQPLGWHAQWFAEIESFPSTVLDYRYPTVPNYGDFTTIKDRNAEPIELLVGGTPCQSFSVAGRRAGLGDPRGHLTLEFIRLAQVLRPRWVVWENVPGVLSDSKGRTFGTVLRALEECGYGWAYRTLDAQFVRVESHSRAVAQRRKRVFVVGCLGDHRRAAAVLFERESLSRHSPPGRETREGVAGTTGARTNRSVGADDAANSHLIPEVAHPLCSRDGRGPDSNTKQGHLIPEVCGTPSGGGGGLNGQAAYSGGIIPVAFDSLGTNVVSGPVPFALRSTPGRSAALLALRSTPGRSAVRKLTPLECERLQGFPPGWTAVPTKRRNFKAEEVEMKRYFERTGQTWPGWDQGDNWRKQASDSARYKAIGNSMAVNVMSWIGRRVEMVNVL